MNLDHLIDQQVAGFRLTKRLGVGGMAAVFRGENVLNPSITRAIKVVLPELASRPEFGQRFAREASILENLQHPNVVRFFGLRTEKHDADQLLIMELELLQGETLTDVLKRHGAALALGTSVEWAKAAAAGVAAAHRLEIVHRDLKPDNLFITTKGDVKVLDFGIAKALDEIDRQEALTRVGTVPGSPAYMAPEVCSGETPTAAADVYALGVVLLEMLLGRHPFSQPGARLSSTQLMFAHVNNEIPRLRTVRPDAPPMLEQVIERACAKDKTWRYKDATELLDALSRVADELRSGETGKADDPSGTQFVLPQIFSNRTPSLTDVKAPRAGSSPQLGSTTSPSVLTGSESAPEKPKRRVALVAGLAAAALAVGGAAVFASQEEPPPAAATATASAAPAPSASAPPAPPEKNPWIRIEPASGDRPQLGVGAVTDESGFKAERKVKAPAYAYEIQQHEVTWEELAEEAEVASTVKPPAWLEGVADKSRYPVTNIPWEAALAYCKRKGASLPTEEEWEYAARGPELRPHPWGEERIDLDRTRAFRPRAAGKPAVDEIMKNDQDVTPGPASRAIYDLAGNAQEWTRDVYRDDAAGQDESWTQAGGVSFRAVRGLPIDEALAKVPTVSAARRSALCATGPCPPDVANVLPLVGFRCARRVP